MCKRPRNEYPESFKELERDWYARLYDEGFRDIEDTRLPGRPLKRSHLELTDERHARLRVDTLEYQAKAEDFFHGPHFHEACTSISKSHGNAGMTARELAKLWELHLAGATERAISSSLSFSKTCVHEALEKLRSWMTSL